MSEGVQIVAAFEDGDETAGAEGIGEGGDALSKFANALMGRSNAPAANTTVPEGPVVRVARGNNVTYVPVGAR